MKRAVRITMLLGVALTAIAAEPEIPPEIKAPAGEKLVLKAHATGQQIYTCKSHPDGAVQWDLKGPDAELHDAKGAVIGHHSAGPSWKHKDGSEVTGKASAHVDSPDPGSIPWLLVGATGHTGTGVFSQVTSIQRLNTHGGKPPAASECTSAKEGTEAKSDYSADYYFYAPAGKSAATGKTVHDVVIRNGLVYDGSGQKPYAGDVAIDGDRIVYVGPPQKLEGHTQIDAKGQAVAPGFVNMLAHPEESLFADGRALSDLSQGVTLEVMGEFSMGPLDAHMKQLTVEREGDIQFPVTWTSLGEYLETLEHRGISPNVASFVGAPTVRTYVLGERDVDPTPEQLAQMRTLVHQAMEQGALGVTTMLIYAPANYAKTPELIALAQESARCGGIYTAHMRSEGDRIEPAIQETIDIAKASGAPAEIYHLKLAGRDNWGKLDRVINMVDSARSSGTRISANMYTYTAGATGLNAAMPLWVQDGGLEAWIARLRDPAIRAKVITEMRNPHPGTWENLYGAAGAKGVLLLAFKNPKLKPLTGKTLAEVAASRGVTAEDAAIDLVIEDGSRVGVGYFLMSEENIRRQVALPWVSFGSDEGGDAPEGVFLLSAAHPRAYGNFARVFAQYVRKDHALSVEEAVRKLASLPADNLSIKDRGRLKVGNFADVVVFDPNTIQDHATYEKPHQLSTGVSYVVVNGQMAITDGKPTGAATGRVVRGRAWTGTAGGGCRGSAKDWTWSNPT